MIGSGALGTHLWPNLVVLVVEPNPITADRTLGMFFGHTFIATLDGKECVDDFPCQLTEVRV